MAKSRPQIANFSNVGGEFEQVWFVLSGSAGDAVFQGGERGGVELPEFEDFAGGHSVKGSACRSEGGGGSMGYRLFCRPLNELLFLLCLCVCVSMCLWVCWSADFVFVFCWLVDSLYIFVFMSLRFCGLVDVLVFVCVVDLRVCGLVWLRVYGSVCLCVCVSLGLWVCGFCGFAC